ncbi:methylthioribulose 1-phosphate dehydratase [Agreia sp. PsM10]|uniref:methylthioribulose 1-phosphate dehydratase n=1 Tax=Agreia sp. PsM10 TaxID=3030533 RepID=UPI00263A7BE2|nr:methylthioribulose 1-phosphate dehydratase [Agreia sp. PsM10]MDN4641535.1 methylthioribulose 1-phosphate dehydratase [Agreia sp. PsM10]
MSIFDDGPVTSEVLDRVGASLAAESARFAARAWMPGTAGNLSVTLGRDPLRLAVTASGLDKGELTPADIVVVDADGIGVIGEGGSEQRPSAEAGLHARIAALTGAGAVIHVHALAAVAAGHHWPGGVVLRDLEMLKGIGHSAHGETVTVPVIANGQDMAVLGDAFEALYVRPAAGSNDVPALIVADHGIYAWGRDLRQARWHLELTEALLQIALARR